MLKSKLTVCGRETSSLKRGSEARVAVVCDGCGKESTTTWNNFNSRANPNDPRTFCHRCANRKSGVEKRGKPVPHVSRSNRRRHGEKSSSWKGGRYISCDGYVVVNVRVPGSDRGSTGWSHYRKEHVVLMEEATGRRMTPSDVVHHIDGDKINNLLSNLWLTDHAGHRNAHASLMRIGYMLIQGGMINFDRNSGTYVADLKLRELLEPPTAATRGQSAAKPTRNGRKVQRLGHGAQNGR